MRESRTDKLALLVACCMAALVVAVAAYAGPTYPSETAQPAVQLPAPPAGSNASSSQPPAGERNAGAAVAESAGSNRDGKTAAVTLADADGYEWSGSRSASQRYLWSHQPE